MLASIVATGRIVETFCGSFSRHKFPLNPVFLIISTSSYLGFRIQLGFQMLPQMLEFKVLL